MLFEASLFSCEEDALYMEASRLTMNAEFFPAY